MTRLTGWGPVFKVEETAQSQDSNAGSDGEFEKSEKSCSKSLGAYRDVRLDDTCPIFECAILVVYD